MHGSRIRGIRRRLLRAEQAGKIDLQAGADTGQLVVGE